jgi:acyl transferase domain-containing protein/acyl carrier protein
MTIAQDVTDRELVLQSLRHIKKLRREIEVERSARTEPIAIVGMACRFPGGADSPAKFWSSLEKGFDAVTDMGNRRWAMDQVYDPNPLSPGKMYTRRAALLDRIDEFDSELFGISDQEAAAMDPQQRLLLEISREAIEHAGYAPKALAGSAAGVFVSLMNIEYATLAGEITAYLGAGNSLSVAAGRISYVFGLRGPCMAVDTACSASVLTVHLGCQNLRSRECDLVLAGGANLLISPATSIAESKAMMLSRSGTCRTFDAGADGYVRGEGCGIVVLKRLSDAQTAGDTIHAIVRGSATNHDGATQGLTAPSGVAQTNVITAALKAANVDPRTVSYVEAHGTGTELGDPIECDALDRVYGAGREPDSRIWVGSVKTNIGHLESAAGIAGLIKTVLMLKNQKIAPHLHLKRVNPHIKWQPCFAVPTTCIGWDGVTGLRRAGLSSFAFSGTNVHLILEEAGEAFNQTTAVAPGVYLLAMSARSADGLARLIQEYIDLLEGCDPEKLPDICFTACVGRDHFRYRLAVVGADCGELRTRLMSALNVRRTPARLLRHAPRLAFMVHAGVDAAPDQLWSSLTNEPAFRDTLQRVDAAYQGSLSRFPATASHEQRMAVLLRYLAIGTLLGQWISEPVLWVANDPVRGIALVASTALELSRELARIDAGSSGCDAGHGSENSATVCKASKAEILQHLQSVGAEAVIHPGGPESTALSLLSSTTWYRSDSDAGMVQNEAHPHRQALEVVAAAYQHGWPVRWESMYDGRRCRRVPIPLHPFDRRRHWLDQGEHLSFAATSTRLFAALYGQNGQKFFEQTITAPAISEHSLFGREIVPASHYIAFVIEAVRQLCGTATCRLRGVAFVEPLILAESRHVLQLMLQPHSATAGEFSVASRLQSAGREGDWTVHATGKVDWAPGIATSRTSSGLSVIQSTWSAVQPPDFYYTAAERRGLALGPAFRWLGTGFKRENSAARILVQPEARCQAADQFTSLDPGMLDACFHVLISCLGESAGAVGDRLFIPTGISELVVRGGIGGGRCFCLALPNTASAERAALDLQLCNEDGSVVLDVSGLSLRPSQPAHRVDNGRHQNIGQLLYQRVWRAIPLTARLDTAGRRILLFGQPGDLSRLTAERLTCLGSSVRVAAWSDRFDAGPGGQYRLDPMQLEHFVQLFRHLNEKDGFPTDVLWLCDDWDPAAGVTLAGLKHAHHRACLPLLHLAQTIASSAIPARCKLWVASAARAGASELRVAELAQAPCLGMLKSLSIELYPGVGCSSVDIGQDDPAKQAVLLVDELASNGEAAEVAYRAGDRYERRLVPAPEVTTDFRLDTKATYLVTGASGGIGGTIARWLVGRGARHLVLISRGGAASLREELVSLLGTAETVHDLRLDVADEVAVERALGKLKQRMPPVKGVFHTAGVLDDVLLRDQNWRRIERVMEPKISGAWNLHRATLDDPPDFFVLFSSASSVFGTPGQTNYAAANAFLDGLAQYRRANGLAACSINWGPWSEVGMASRLDAKRAWFGELGITPLAPSTALEALEAVVAGGSASVTVIDCDWSKGVGRIGTNLASELASGPPATGNGQTHSGSLRIRLAEATAERRTELLLNECRRAVEEILKQTLADDDLRCTLMDLGIDSLAALRLRYGLHEELGVDIPLTHLLGELDIVALAGRIEEHWEAASGQGQSIRLSPARAAGAMLTEIEL